MTTLCNTYSTETEALAAVDALRALGVSDRDVRLLIGRPLGDLRREAAGGFAGPVLPDDPVGTYAGGSVLRRRAAGGFSGDPDAQRQGSFADTDRVEIVTLDGRRRITGLRGARQLLSRTAIDRDVVERATGALSSGSVVALVDLGDANAQLERLAA